jgi:hemoglobin
MEGKPASLYTRLGGYDAIAAVVGDLLPRLRSDDLLSRFWTSPRSVDTLNRERQLAIDFIAAAAGGPTIYLGRDMKMSHKGMGITKADYDAFMRCLALTLSTFEVPEAERGEVVAFVTSLEPEIVEA